MKRAALMIFYGVLFGLAFSLFIYASSFLVTKAIKQAWGVVCS